MKLKVCVWWEEGCYKVVQVSKIMSSLIVLTSQTLAHPAGHPIACPGSMSRHGIPVPAYIFPSKPPTHQGNIRKSLGLGKSGSLDTFSPNSEMQWPYYFQ